MDTYLTIQRSSDGLYKEKGSRFIAYAFHVSNTDEVKAHLQDLHKQYHDARHICYAYALGFDAAEFRANDDGEPSGTGGKPIHGVLLSNKLTYTLIAVVRYFGGVKLGVSGLIHAYREAAIDAILNNEIIEKTVDVEFRVSFEYPLMNELMRIVKEENCEITAQNFEMTCTLAFKIRKNDAEKVSQRLQKVEGLVIED